MTLEDATWVVVDGRPILAEGKWKAEAEMSPEDIAYNFRRGVLITPGLYEKILKRLEEKP